MARSGLRLRSFHDDEFEVLFQRIRGWLPAEVAKDEPGWRDQVARRITQSGSWGDDGLDYAIEFDDRLVGAVQAVGAYYRLPTNVYELGIEFYNEDHRGRGLGSQTLRLFLPQVFAAGAIRLQGRTHIENRPMIRLFERFGFQREGIMRRMWPLPGLCGDMVLYALTDQDYTD